MNIIILAFVLLLTGGVTYLADGGAAPVIMARHLLIAAFCAGLVLFAAEAAQRRGEFDRYGKSQKKKFYIVFLLHVTLMCLAALWPWVLLPMPFFAVAYAVYGGVSAAAMGLGAAISFGAAMGAFGPGLLLAYYLAGLTGILLYEPLERGKKFGGALFAVHMVFLSFLAIWIFLYDDIMNAVIWLTAVLAVAADCILLGVFVPACCRRLFPCYDDVYDKMTVQNYELLARLKERNEDAYYRAMHTARLSGKVATGLELDALLVRAGSYYRKIRILYEEGEPLPAEIPPPLLPFIEGSGEQPDKPQTKEQAVIMLSSALVSAVLNVKKKAGPEGIRYDKLVEVLLRKKLEDGSLDDCGLSPKDLRLIRKYYMEEGLYYSEFLH